MVLIILLSAIGMKQALSEAQHRRWSEYGVLQCVGGERVATAGLCSAWFSELVVLDWSRVWAGSHRVEWAGSC